MFTLNLCVICFKKEKKRKQIRKHSLALPKINQPNLPFFTQQEKIPAPYMHPKSRNGQNGRKFRFFGMSKGNPTCYFLFLFFFPACRNRHRCETSCNPIFIFWWRIRQTSDSLSLLLRLLEFLLTVLDRELLNAGLAKCELWEVNELQLWNSSNSSSSDDGQQTWKIRCKLSFGKLQWGLEQWGLGQKVNISK